MRLDSLSTESRAWEAHYWPAKWQEEHVGPHNVLTITDENFNEDR